VLRRDNQWLGLLGPMSGQIELWLP
jgi:hypothetical protein